jgi:tetratricopeptide (TPR) repeat protein
VSLFCVLAVRVGAGMEAEPAAAVPSLREQGNALFKEKNYLKAAAVYTQAIKADPENAALYRCIFFVVWSKNPFFLVLLGLLYGLQLGFLPSPHAVAQGPDWNSSFRFFFLCFALLAVVRS